MDIGQFAFQTGAQTRRDLEQQYRRKLLESKLLELHDRNPRAVEGMARQLAPRPAPAAGPGGFQPPGAQRMGQQQFEGSAGKAPGWSNDNSGHRDDYGIPGFNDVVERPDEPLDYFGRPMTQPAVDTTPAPTDSAMQAAIRERYNADMDASTARQKATLAAQDLAAGSYSPPVQGYQQGGGSATADPKEMAKAEKALFVAQHLGDAKATAKAKAEIAYLQRGAAGASQPQDASPEPGLVLQAPGGDQTVLTNRPYTSEQDRALRARYGASGDLQGPPAPAAPAGPYDGLTETARVDRPAPPPVTKDAPVFKPAVKQPKEPTGYRYTENGDLEAIPGGPADAKLAIQREKKASLIASLNQKAEVITSSIDDALDKAGFMETGLTGSLVGKVAGTDAYDLRRIIDTVKANIGFEELSAMRQASPTGGALGQVAVQELSFLQSVLGSLDADQSEGELKKKLRRVREHYKNFSSRIANAEAKDAAREAPAVGGGDAGGEDDLDAELDAALARLRGE